MAKAAKAKTTEREGTGSGPENFAFQAEVARLLHLMAHSVYSDRDVFLRELISNASDALDRLRYEALASPAIRQDGDPEIVIAADKAAGTLTVADNGIGMDRDELIDNLGTIARSGSQAFMQKAAEAKGDLHLIGQFGIGFYAAFMVAQRVEVLSRRAGSGEWHKWASEGTGEFTVEPVAAEGLPASGTRITLFLREDAREFLEPHRIEEIVTAYSDHVAHPIMLALDATTRRRINSASAIWMRPKAEVSADQYKEFSGHVCGLYGDPALTIHYRAEGRNEYTVLLFVPSERPFDLFDPARAGRQKLYVRRVFITDDADLLPAYLRFVRGVIDSEDMPLNISREMLQDNPTVKQIRKAVTNRVLAELKKCAESEPERYTRIWKAFGPVIKEGLYEDMERRDQLFEIVRFRSTRSDGETVSLGDYVARLKENQAAIYYLTGEDAERAARNPRLEGFRARDVEVLLLTDPVDSFWVRTALGYGGKPFRSLEEGADDLARIPLTEGEAAAADDPAAFGTLLAVLKQTLGERIKDAVKSNRLTTSPVCLSSDKSGIDRTLEKLLARQRDTGVTVSAPVLEVNAGHPLIKALAARARSDGASSDMSDAAHLLLDQAHILEGEAPPDGEALARRLALLMERVFTAA
jgi:molecular chaperone HtpG